MFIVKDTGSFNLFMPSEDIIPHVSEQTAICQRTNAEYIVRNSHQAPPDMRISGSYICPHAPDYVGLPTLTWDERRWQSLFQDMKASGLDTVVFQASIWNELGECYYGSKRFSKEYRIWNVVEPMLAAASEEGMQVFLGGYGSVIGWLGAKDQRLIDIEVERQLACMEELLALKHGFAGIYFSPENAFEGKRDLENEKLLNRLYREYFSKIKEIAPDKLVAMSPASMFHKGMKNEFLSFWDSLLDGVPLDILMPQDSIGTAGCSLENQSEMWQLWKMAADSNEVRLWCHLEIFERREFGGVRPFLSADPQRVLAQLKNVEPFVERCICFEYPYFAGDAEGAAELKKQIFAPAYELAV